MKEATATAHTQTPVTKLSLEEIEARIKALSKELLAMKKIRKAVKDLAEIEAERNGEK